MDLLLKIFKSLNMKKSIFNAFCSFVLLFCFAVSGSGQQYDEFGFMIRFEDGTSQDSIDAIKGYYNCDELWVSPLTNTHYWQVNRFPFVIPGTTDTISDINETSDKAENRSEVNETDLDYIFKSIPFSSSVGSAGPPIDICNQKISNPRDEGLSPVKVCIMDTGYSPTHNNINVTSGYNYVSNNFNLDDNNGHGTKVTYLVEQTILDNTFNGSNIEFDIRKTHNEDGDGLLSNILLATEEAIIEGANIINMSFSYFDNINAFESNIFKNTINHAEINNILIVCASGNESIEIQKPGLGSLTSYPSVFENYNLLTVGSFNCETKDLSNFSNYGLSEVDITASGENIEFPFSQGSNETVFSGTSFSAPIVTGIAAALAQYQNSFDYIGIKCAIMRGADIEIKLANQILSSGNANAENALIELNSGCDEIITDSKHAHIIGRSSQKTISFFPNPVENFAQIKTNNNIEFIRILNLQSQLISVINKNQISSKINLSFLDSGIYILQISTPQETYLESLVKI